MIVAAAAVVMAIAFHLIPSPSDITDTSEFQLGGYTVGADGTTKTLTDMPQFIPETADYRPSADIAFVAPFDGQCLAAQTETVDGTTQFIVAVDPVEVKAHTQVYLKGVLMGLDDLKGDPWLPLVEERYRIVVACESTDGSKRVISSFYEVPTPPPSWRNPT